MREQFGANNKLAKAAGVSPPMITEIVNDGTGAGPKMVKGFAKLLGVQEWELRRRAEEWAATNPMPETVLLAAAFRAVAEGVAAKRPHRFVASDVDLVVAQALEHGVPSLEEARAERMLEAAAYLREQTTQPSARPVAAPTRHVEAEFVEEPATQRNSLPAPPHQMNAAEERTGPWAPDRVRRVALAKNEDEGVEYFTEAMMAAAARAKPGDDAAALRALEDARLRELTRITTESDERVDRVRYLDEAKRLAPSERFAPEVEASFLTSWAARRGSSEADKPAMALGALRQMQREFKSQRSGVGAAIPARHGEEPDVQTALVPRRKRGKTAARGARK